MVTLYGIANCDKVRAARRWLDAHHIDYRFHDFRKDGVDDGRLSAWSQTLGWEALLNRRGTTWRQLPPQDREGVDAQKAVALMTAHPALIKRPVLDLNGSLHVGFRDKEYEQLFS
ncbi:MAG: ArsC family reductase [Gammaproteobacteria bacterium]